MSLSNLSDEMREHKKRYREHWAREIQRQRLNDIPTNDDIHIDHDWVQTLMLMTRSMHRAEASRDRANAVKYRKRTYGEAAV